MDTKISLIITLAVGIIMVGSLVAPIVTSYADEELTYTNEGMPFAEVDDDTHTITVTSSAITVDGEEIDQDLFPAGFTSYTIVYGESSFIRYTTNDLVVQYVSSSTTSFNYSSATVTISISGTTATVTTTADATTATMSGVLFYIAADGDYVLSKNPCVTSETALLGEGYTDFDVGYIATIWSGNTESVTASVVRFAAGTATVSSTDVNTTVVNGDLVRIDSVLINYDATVSDTEYDLTSTYTYFIVPETIVYDNPAYIGTGSAAVLGAVVVVFLAALLFMAYKGIGRDD